MLTPFQAWLPEITTEEERLEVSVYQNTVNLIAFVIGAGVTFLIPAIIGSKDEITPEAFQDPNSILSFLTNGQLLTLIVLVFASFVIIFFSQIIPF